MNLERQTLPYRGGSKGPGYQSGKPYKGVRTASIPSPGHRILTPRLPLERILSLTWNELSEAPSLALGGKGAAENIRGGARDRPEQQQGPGHTRGQPAGW